MGVSHGRQRAPGKSGGGRDGGASGKESQLLGFACGQRPELGALPGPTCIISGCIPGCIAPKSAAGIAGIAIYAVGCMAWLARSSVAL